MENSFLNELITTDVEWFIYLNNLGNQSWDSFWLLVTSKYFTIPLYLVLVGYFFKKFGLKKTLLFVVLAILLVTASDQISNFFKFGFKRLRPCYQPNIYNVMRLVKQGCGGKYSYFSAHASTAMALAIYFGLVFKQFYKFIPYFLILVAFFVGYSRIYIGVHFPLDVLTGFLIGFVLAYLFNKIFLSVSNRFF